MNLSVELVGVLKENIVGILRQSNLNTISTKAVRLELATKVGLDLEPHKTEVNALIVAQFDLMAQDSSDDDGDDDDDEEEEEEEQEDRDEEVKPVERQAAVAVKNENHQRADKPVGGDRPRSQPKPTARSASQARKMITTTGPKPATTKKTKKELSMEEKDAILAARLQAEENCRMGGRVRQVRAVEKKRPKSRVKKSDAKVDGSDGDHPADEPGEKKESKRSGGFHKPMLLSPALSDLLGGTKTLSRPQTVKMIWKYIHDNDLQDAADKRQIRCDDALRAVFKTDKVHMFTMNKLLTSNLFPADDL